MNVFYLNHDPEQAALDHCSQHRAKMIIEYCQILSTAHRLLDNIDDDNEDYYKVTHVNHPSVVWARESKYNYMWVYRCMAKLAQLMPNIAPQRLVKLLSKPPMNIPSTPFFYPPVAAPSCFKELAKRNGVVYAYQHYCNYKFFVWRIRDYKQRIYVYFHNRPSWYVRLKKPNWDYVNEVIEADRR